MDSIIRSCDDTLYLLSSLLKDSFETNIDSSILGMVLDKSRCSRTTSPCFPPDSIPEITSSFVIFLTTKSHNSRAHSFLPNLFIKST